MSKEHKTCPAVCGNPFMAPWERIPDGEPRVFTDPEQSRTLIGEGMLKGTGTTRVLSIPVTSLRGKKAIYFEFISDAEGPVCKAESFRFTVGE